MTANDHGAPTCPACELPAVGVCAERADGIHPDLDTYAEEMTHVLSARGYAEWAERTGGPPR